MGTGSPIVIALTVAERRLLERLRRAGATTPGAAVHLDQLPRLEAGRLQRLVEASVVREGEPGTFYLDQVAYASYRRRRQLTAVTVITVLVAILFAVWLWLRLQGRV